MITIGVIFILIYVHSDFIIIYFYFASTSAFTFDSQLLNYENTSDILQLLCKNPKRKREVYFKLDAGSTFEAHDCTTKNISMI